MNIIWNELMSKLDVKRSQCMVGVLAAKTIVYKDM